MLEIPLFYCDFQAMNFNNVVRCSAANIKGGCYVRLWRDTFVYYHLYFRLAYQTHSLKYIQEVIMLFALILMLIIFVYAIHHPD